LYSLVAVGLNLQYGVTRILNVAHGQFLTIGAYITWTLFVYDGVDPLVSLVISGPTVFVLGVLIQIVAFRRLVSQSKVAEELEARSLLACFGLLFVIESVLAAIYGVSSIGVKYLSIPVLILGRTFALNMIVAAVMAIIISLALFLMLRFTRIGLAMRATVEEPTGAQLVGINTLRIHAVTFGLGALLAALAGSMLIMIGSEISPSFGSTYTFIALAVIILGGMGSFVGSLLGGFIIGYVSYASWMTAPLLQYVGVYLVVIILLIIRPKGLFGR
jgi:branched-chain amino acid transport system permease protein